MALYHVLYYSVYPSTGCFLAKDYLLADESISQFCYRSYASSARIILTGFQVNLISLVRCQFRFYGHVCQAFVYFGYFLDFLCFFHAAGMYEIFSKGDRLYGSRQIEAMKEYLSKQGRLVYYYGEVVSLKCSLRGRVLQGY